MCGIFALSRATRSSIPNAFHFTIAGTLAIESRGRHATGHAWTDDQGWPWYWKQPGAASKVVHNTAMPRRGLRTVLAHTRYATNGDPSDNHNNHPHTAPRLTLVHNGRVDNDNELLDLVNATDNAITTCDSEALAWLMHEAHNDSLTHPADLLQFVEGVASLAWMTADDPDVLHLARCSTRPMHIGWTRRGDLVMSSTEQSLRATARAANVGIHRIRSVDEGTYLRVEQGKITEVETFDVHDPTTFVPEDTHDDTDAFDLSDALLDVERVNWDELVHRRGWA